MVLNVEHLLVLADRLDADGKCKEATELDDVIKSLSVVMVKDVDPEFEKEFKEEHGYTPKTYVGKSEEDVTPEDAPMSSPDPKELSQQEGVGLSDSLKSELSKLMEQGWNIFGPGELDMWMGQSGRGKYKPKDIDPAEVDKFLADLGIEAADKKYGVLEKLSVIADRLDNLGATEEASLIDGFIKKHADDVLNYQGEDEKGEQSKRYDSKYHHSLQIREPKTKQERIDREGREKHHVHTMQSVEAGALNSRYCPEHIGVSLGRVGELTYQCPLDGAVYNWETGWTDFDGKEHPGGSVAAQTPDSSGYAIPSRIFDSRENILNRVN